MVEIPDDPVKKITGCFHNGANLNVVKPVIFLGGTVISFNASLGIGPTQESTLTVDLINDCEAEGDCLDPDGEFFTGFARIGSPVFFSVCESMALEKGDEGCFEFGGILQNVTINQGGSGRTFQARVVDPRSLLNNVMLIVGSHVGGPIKHKNYFNVYGYYEHMILHPSSRYQNLADDPPEDIDENLLLPLSPGFGNPGAWHAITPSGDLNQVDCKVFGTADSDERGMSYRKVLQGLKALKPIVFSPNYGEEYNPNLCGRLLNVMAGKLKHEDNLFKLDISGLPDPPPYYRVAGPYISVMDLITSVCDAMGHEFYVTLEEPIPVDEREDPIDELWTIKIVTKQATPQKDDAPPPSIWAAIVNYDGSAVDLSFGKELRIDKNRSVLYGEQRHDIYNTTQIDFYFGEDSNGDPIIPRVGDAELFNCGFLVDVEINDLNAQLACPLFDYADVDIGIPGLYGTGVDKIVNRKVTLSEYDIRAALSSVELWKKRVFSSGIPEDVSLHIPGKAGDFNKLIRYNFPDLTNMFVKGLIESVAKGEDTNSNKTHTPTAVRAFRDVIDLATSKSASALASSWASQVDSIHAFVENLGRTYYGKQFIVTLDLDICAIPAGVYDENYYGIKDSGSPPAGIAYTGTECGADVVIPSGKVYRPTIFTHSPTNDGGWVEPCDGILGLTASGAYLKNNDNWEFYDTASLDFFKTEDNRVTCFARFDSRDVKVVAQEGVYRGDKPNGDITRDDLTWTNIGEFLVPGNCGNIDTSVFPEDEMICVRFSGGICVPPSEKYPDLTEREKGDYENIPTSGIISGDPQPIVCYIKANVTDKVYVSEYEVGEDRKYTDGSKIITANSNCEEPESKCKNKTQVVVEFSSPLINKVCNDKVDFSQAVMAVSQALAIGSGVLLNEDNQAVLSGDLANPDKAQSLPNICGLPVVSGLTQAQGAVDSSALNSKGFYGSAGKPSLIAVPIKSNIETYGPWYSSNFFEGDGSSGGVSINQDADFAPWNYGSEGAMNKIGEGVVNESRCELTELESGSINYPYWPELKLGFLENGPNLTNITVVFGGNGVTSNYTFQTYTPRFGNLKSLENSHLKESIANKQKSLKIIKDRDMREDKIRSKLKGTVGRGVSPPKNAGLQNQGTAARILIGEMYDFNVIHSGSMSGDVVGTGQRTVVGLDTLEKSVLELRYDYKKKAFTSLDSVYSPISISGDGGLPRFSRTYSFDNRLRVSDISPGTHPPFIPGLCSDGNQISTSTYYHPTHPIINSYLNPYTNPSGNIYGSGNSFNVGHGLDMVGRETGVPGKGCLTSLYSQEDGIITPSARLNSQPASKYSEDYRFLGLKGPLVLHSWGYDIDNRPIPNAIDDEKLIMQSGVFLVRGNKKGIRDESDNPDTSKIPSDPNDDCAIGLKDEFLKDWLQKPATWPVGPIDLRWDRKRSMWVCPPGHSIILAQIIKEVPAHGYGSGVILQQGNGIYRQQSDRDGNIISKSGCPIPTSTETETEIPCSSSASDYKWIIMSVGDYGCEEDNSESWQATGAIINVVTGVSFSNNNLCLQTTDLFLPHSFLKKNGADVCTKLCCPTETETPTPSSIDKWMIFESCCEYYTGEGDPPVGKLRALMSETPETLFDPYIIPGVELGYTAVMPPGYVTSITEPSNPSSCWQLVEIKESAPENSEYDVFIYHSEIVVGFPDCETCISQEEYICPTETETPTETSTETPTETSTETETPTPTECSKHQDKVGVIKIADYVGQSMAKGDLIYAYYDPESDTYIAVGGASGTKNIISAKWESDQQLTVKCSILDTIPPGTIIPSGCGEVLNPLGFEVPPTGCYAYVMLIGYAVDTTICLEEV